MDDDLRKRLLAIDVLLQEPEDITDPLESELHALRDRLQAIALSSPAPQHDTQPRPIGPRRPGP
jgi:hypothetical protein